MTFGFRGFPSPFHCLPTFKLFMLNSDNLHERETKMIAEEKSMGPFNLQRRKHPRFSIDLPAKYWPINIPQSCSSRTENISEGGVLLYLPEKIEVGQNIGVKILISTGFECESIEALGQAAWSDSQSAKEEYPYRTGVKFVDISAENMKRLKGFLDAQMNLGSSPKLNISSRFRPSYGISVGKDDGKPPVNEPRRGNEWKLLQKGEEETFSAEVDGKEEDATKLPPELIFDFQQEYNDEQRQNLHHKILEMGIPERQRLAILGNREARSTLIRDPNMTISLNVLKNAKINESEILHYAQRRDLAQDILLGIAQEQKWKKNYPIKLALVSNPKTPLSVSIGLISYLQERDLKSLSQDKNVSSVLRRKIQEIFHKRSGK